ncbi:MAG TPA: tripartite tricarboxylate transporter substrate binding protein [Burkholderiales bacterium]|nr:tripartite tricarboxylate transporter substrate binding protein [Burkholderiales bacterium]
MVDLTRAYARIAAGAALAAVFCAATAAENTAYPNKPIRMIVPFPPGGGTDFVARVISPSLTEALGQNVLIDNRTGAQGVVGTQIAAQAANDGYTIVIVDAATVIAPAMMDKAPFDVAKDFAPIGMLVEQPYLITVHPSVPAKNLGEFVKLVQANPGKYNFGSGAAIAHVSQEVFYSLAKLKMTHVPYRGTGPLMTAIVGNEVQATFSGPGSALPMVKSGRLRPLAVTTLKRSRELPDVPTLDELGYKGFEIRGWYGLLAPAGTPRPIVTRLNSELNKVLSSGPASQALRQRGLDPAPVSPDEFRKFLLGEVVRWSKAVKDYNVKPAE